MGELRNLIATTLQREVELALTLQRESQFPELADVRKQLEDYRESAEEGVLRVKKKLKERQEELDQIEIGLKVRENAVLKKEKQLIEVVQAVKDYDAWVNGVGGVDDNGKVFQKLWDACKSFVKGGK